MLVAAYQAPLRLTNSFDALPAICERVQECEALGISILCCPEAVLGGLADYSENPVHFAVGAYHGQLETVLAPLASETVTTIFGYTELGATGVLYNSAAVYSRGSV